MNYKRLAEATTFAAMAHKDATRKGHDELPYIVHPIESGLIAMSITNDEDVIIAAFLHDVVEDTNKTIEDIKAIFGNRVAELVAYESEDKMEEMQKSDSWKLRKIAFLEHLKNAPVEAKIVCLSDKISNMRLMAKDFADIGNKLWNKFNQKDPKEQAWYYKSIADETSELKETEAWKEYVNLCNTVFGK